MGKSRRILRRAREEARTGLRSRWGGLVAVFVVLLMLEILATTGFVDGVMEPARAGSPGTYFAEGDIVGANPSSTRVAGVTEAEFFVTCAYPPDSQGVDGWVFQLPENFSRPAPFTVTGDSSSPAYDLNVYLYNEACELTESFATASPDEEGEIPAGIPYVVVDQFIGADTHVTLCAGDPKGCVTASTSNGSTSPPNTTSSPPGEGEMSTTLKSSRSIALYRQGFRLSGVVSGDAECGKPGDHVVGVTKRVLGTDETKSVDRAVPVDEDGSWSINHRSSYSARYVAHVSPSKACESSASDPEIVRVRVDVEVTDRPNSCHDEVHGVVRPNHKGTKVELQRHSNKKFRPTSIEDGLDEDSRFDILLYKCGLYRVVWMSQDPSNMWGADTFKVDNN